MPAILPVSFEALFKPGHNLRGIAVIASGLPLDPRFPPGIFNGSPKVVDRFIAPLGIIGLECCRLGLHQLAVHPPFLVGEHTYHRLWYRVHCTPPLQLICDSSEIFVCRGLEYF